MNIKRNIRKIIPITLAIIATIGCEAKSPQSNTVSTSPVSPSSIDANSSNKDTSSKANTNLRSGKFISVAYPVSGQFTISFEGDKAILDLDESFKSPSGPDLRIVFHKAPDLTSVAAPPSYGIDEADYIVIEKLKSTSGKQRYEIPNGAKLKNFKSVAIWCAKMNKTYGFATLN